MSFAMMAITAQMIVVNPLWGAFTQPLIVMIIMHARLTAVMMPLVALMLVLTAMMTMPARTTRVTLLWAANTHQHIVMTTMLVQPTHVMQKMVVRIPLSTVVIAMLALLILVILQLATAILPIFHAMMTMPAQMTAVIQPLDARILL
jgi:hypothetical protein